MSEKLTIKYFFLNCQILQILQWRPLQWLGTIKALHSLQAVTFARGDFAVQDYRFLGHYVWTWIQYIPITRKGLWVVLKQSNLSAVSARRLVLIGNFFDNVVAWDEPEASSSNLQELLIFRLRQTAWRSDFKSIRTAWPADSYVSYWC